MRRVLICRKLLQLSSEEVHETSGASLPTDVQAISHSLLNDKFVHSRCLEYNHYLVVQEERILCHVPCQFKDSNTHESADIVL